MNITGKKVYKVAAVFSTVFLLVVFVWNLYNGITENNTLLFTVIISNIILYPIIMKNEKKI